MDNMSYKDFAVSIGLSNRLTESDKEEMLELCSSHGFKRRGKVYFRVIGDGILQAMKLSYERVFQHYSLDVGFRSMYDENKKDDFTAKSIVPYYSICCLQGEQTAVLCKMVDEFVSVHVLSVQDQLAILKEDGFAWLDTVNNHKKLSKTLCELDQTGGGSIIWHDREKFVPYLVTEDYASADYVLAAILQQHLYVKAWTTLPWTDDDFRRYAREYPDKDEWVLRMHDMIASKDYTRIRAYLDENYARNMTFAKFLRRP